MTLSSQQVRQFEKSGYTIVPRFFSSNETLAMQLEVQRWIEEGLPRDVSTDPAQKNNLQLIPLFTRSSLFRALPFDAKVITAVESLIGSPVVKILDQMFYKPSKKGMGTSWHTDNAYFKLENPMHGTAMWIAIHDATEENGTLKVLPDVFHTEFPHERDPASDHHIHTRLDDTTALHCEMQAGGVVFFCFGTPHSTGPNRSDQDRAGIGIHFVNRAALDVIHQTRWEQVELSQPYTTNGKSEYHVLNNFQTEVQAVLRGRDC